MTKQDPTPHQMWMQAGHCHYVHRTKAWCNDDEGHEGPHWAVRLTPDGGMKKEVLHEVDR